MPWVRNDPAAGTRTLARRREPRYAFCYVHANRVSKRVATDEPIIDIEKLAAQIVEYFARHPHAADTLAGIQSWWLAGGATHASSRDVERAVQILERCGTLEARTLPDGTRIFTRARRTSSR